MDQSGLYEITVEYYYCTSKMYNEYNTLTIDFIVKSDTLLKALLLVENKLKEDNKNIESIQYIKTSAITGKTFIQ